MSRTSLARATADRLGPIGVWSGRLHRRSIAEAQERVSIWEELGYVILTRSAEEARSAARANLGRYLTWANHRRHLTRLGFTEEDFGSGGSDRLIDALYAWGDEGGVQTRVQEHLNAGADHVCIQIVPTHSSGESESLTRLAPPLL